MAENVPSCRGGALGGPLHLLPLRIPRGTRGEAPRRVRAWWWLAASREGSSLQGELDAFVSEAVPLVTRIPSVEEQFAVLKLFHGLG